jgi:hypothetical protein
MDFEESLSWDMTRVMTNKEMLLLCQLGAKKRKVSIPIPGYSETGKVRLAGKDSPSGKVEKINNDKEVVAIFDVVDVLSWIGVKAMNLDQPRVS